MAGAFQNIDRSQVQTWESASPKKRVKAAYQSTFLDPTKVGT